MTEEIQTITFRGTPIQKWPKDGIRIPGFRITPTGILIEEGAEPRGAIFAFSMILFFAKSIDYHLGDMMLYMAEEHGETFMELSDFRGIDPRRLARAIFVSQRIPYELRSPLLCFEHGAAVAEVEDIGERKYYLDLAARMNLTPTQLRMMVTKREAKLGNGKWHDRTKVILPTDTEEAALTLGRMFKERTGELIDALSRTKYGRRSLPAMQHEDDNA